MSQLADEDVWLPPASNGEDHGVNGHSNQSGSLQLCHGRSLVPGEGARLIRLLGGEWEDDGIGRSTQIG